MQHKRTTFVLMAVAVALMSYIVFYEQHTLSTGEVAERRSQVLPRLVRDRVERIQIDRGDETLVMVRERAEEGELGEWRLEEPVRDEADQEAVSSMLGSLEWAAARRTLEDTSAVDRTGWGLDEPRVRVSVRVANEDLQFAIGGEEATTRGVWMRLSDENTVHVVGLDVFEAVDHDAGHFRSKDLFRDIGEQEVSRVELAGAGPDRVIEKRDGRFWLLEPVRMHASAGRTDALVQAIVELSAARFVEGDAAELLAESSLMVVVRAGQDAEAEETRLVVGGVCAEHASERYGRIDEGPLVCIPATALDAFEVSAEDFRELRAVTAPDHEVAGVVLATSAGTLTVTDSEDEGWRFTFEGGSGDSSGAVDEEALSEWLRELRGARAGTVVPLPDDAALAGVGLDEPAGTLTLQGRGDAEDRVLRIGGTALEGVFVQRGDEPVALSLDREALELLTPSAIRLRGRNLITDRLESAVELRIRRAGIEERVVRTDDLFAVQEPLEVSADPGRVSSLLRRLAALSAVRFEAPAALASHGLANPRLEVTVRFEGALPSDDDEAEHEGESTEEPAPRAYTLQIGAETTDGAFARLEGDPAVFLVPGTLVADLEEPLVSRVLLGTDRDYVDDLSLTTPGGRFELHHDGRAFVMPDGAPDRDRTDALLDAIERLRAAGVSRYGAPEPADGLDAPRLTLWVRRDAEADPPREYTLLFGAEVGEGDDARVHVRREDLAVGFFVLRSAVAPILDYEP